MYYVEDQDPILVKQEVELEVSELKGLYQAILARFGKYVHRSYDAAFGPYAFQKGLEELKYIKNYSETPVGEDENVHLSDNVSNAMDMMHYEYDEFVAPELAGSVKRLLEGDVKAIAEIKKGPSPRKKDENGRERDARKELQEFLVNAPDELDAEKFQRLTAKVLRYYQEDVAEEQQEELKQYYAKVLSCIHFKPVMTLYKDKWNELRRAYKDVKAFYEGTNEFEDEFARVMK